MINTHVTKEPKGRPRRPKHWSATGSPYERETKPIMPNYSEKGAGKRRGSFNSQPQADLVFTKVYQDGYQYGEEL